MFLAISLQAQAHNTGNEFWLCFDQNYREDVGSTVDKLSLRLTISAAEDADIKVDIESISFHADFHLQAGQNRLVGIPSQAVINQSGIRKGGGVHVQSTGAISVVGFNHRFQTSDSFGALSVTALGSEYRLVGLPKLGSVLLSQASIIATEDGTRIVIEGTKISDARESNMKEVVLQRGDVFHVEALEKDPINGDISTVLVRADKPIAVFSGHMCGQIPIYCQSCNTLVEQLLPISSWGKHFVTMPLPMRRHYSLRFVSHSATKISTVWSDGQSSFSMGPGEVHDIMSATPVMSIESSEPVEIVQFSHGHKDGDDAGDPCMFRVPALEQMAKDYLVVMPFWSNATTLATNKELHSETQTALTKFSPQQPTTESTPIASKYVPVELPSSTKPNASIDGAELLPEYWKQYALVVLPSDAISSMRVGGQAPAAESFHAINSIMSVGMIELNANQCGVHISCAKPFAFSQYGIGAKLALYDVYAHGW